jgi:hypothetical protein
VNEENATGTHEQSTWGVGPYSGDPAKDPNFAKFDPELLANGARVEEDLGVETWYLGIITPDDQYIGLTQAFDTNPSWLANKLQGNWLDVTVEIEGRTWEVWPTLLPSIPRGTKEYAMVHTFDDQAVVIFGTASETDFNKLATEISRDLNEGK